MKDIYAMLFALAVFCSSCINDTDRGVDLAVGDNIPRFTVTMNDGSTITGRQLSKGNAVVVFFTTSCPDCRMTLPHVQKIYDEYHPYGVQFAVIGRQEGAEQVSKYWKENCLTMPYSPQEDRKVYERFAKNRVPRVYIIQEGVIKAVFTDSPAPPTYDDIKSEIDKL